MLRRLREWIVNFQRRGSHPTSGLAARGRLPSRLLLEQFEERITPVIFTNSTPIVINDAAIANPYPSQISIISLPGVITDLNVILNNVTHSQPGDIEALLVAPNGRRFVFVSDAGDDNNDDVTVIFDDEASGRIPVTGGWGTSGTTQSYQPTDYAVDTDNFPAPAPQSPYPSAGPGGSATLASTFNGIDPNGAWSLFVLDDAEGNAGIINGGWSLDVTVANLQATQTVLNSAPNPAFTDQSVNFIARVTQVVDGAPVAAGSITFMESGVVLQGATAVDASGQAVFTASPTFFTAGNHDVVALYHDDAANPQFADSSDNVVQVMNSPAADLFVTKSAPVRTALRSTFVYTVTVSNAGPGTARNVVLHDVLPALTVLVSQVQTSGPAFALSNAGNDLRDTAEALPAGAVATFSITVFAPLPGVAVNVADVSASTVDPKLGNNSATAVTLIGNRKLRFVAQVYRDLFGREVRPRELAQALAILNGPGPQGVLRHQVVIRILKSLLYQARVTEVAYWNLLDEAPDREDCAHYLDRMVRGATIEQVRAETIGSQEYFQQQGGGSVAGWTASLYQDVLGRAPTSAEFAAVRAALARNLSRTSIALGLIHSNEARVILVRGWFQEFLQRNPTPAELRRFITSLNNGVRDEALIAQILSSAEYLQKV